MNDDASPALEAFVKELIQRSAACGYYPTTFMRMLERHRTKKAMALLVEQGEIQSGFRRLHELGLLDWSVEAGVVKFRGEFDRMHVEAAEWRLRQANGEASV